MTNSESTTAKFSDYLKSWPLYLVPHHLVSRLILKLTRLKPFKKQVINWFIKKYNVDMTHALVQDVSQFEHFNAFFTRALKPAARPIGSSEHDVVCPADGKISAIGTINTGQIYQAKGHHYSLQELLGNNQEFSSRLENGKFVTVYLSPRDYHRVHMPVTGKLISHTLIPGRLFSVGPHTVRTVPRLFARNERLVANFETSQGAMSMVLVGAINVGAIETVWSGLVTPPAARNTEHIEYAGTESITLEKGVEMGRFNMGSTVILLCENPVAWLDIIETGVGVQMGQTIAEGLVT